MTTPLMTTPPHPTSTPSAPAGATAPWRIEGPLVISTVTDWHRRLIESLAAHPEPVIDLGGVTAVDAFGLQLLLAARQDATAAGRTLTLAAVPPVFDDACAATGLARSLFSTPTS